MSETVDYSAVNAELFADYQPVRDLVHLVLENPNFGVSEEDQEAVQKGLVAYEELILSNMGLVYSITNRLSFSKQEEREVLEQAGMIGLIQAVRGFKPELGYEFSTYASSLIEPAVFDAGGQELKPHKLSTTLRRDLRVLSRAFREIEKTTAIAPNVEELAEQTGFSAKKIQYLEDIKYRLRTLSLDAKSDDSPSLGDTLEDTADEYTAMRIRKLIAEGLEELSERDREIISIRLGLSDEETPDLRSLGKRFNLTHEAIRKIQNKALEVLREKLGEEFDVVVALKKGVNTMQAKSRNVFRKDQMPIDVDSPEFSAKLTDLDERYQQLVWLFFDKETGQQIRTAGEVKLVTGDRRSAGTLRTYLASIRSALS